MRKLTFINKNNNQISISTIEPYLLLDFDGGVSNTVYSNKGVNQDGETYQGNNLEPREMAISFVVCGNSRNDLLRKKALINKVFNPKMGQGTLVYTDDGIERKLDCMVDALPFFKDKNIFNSICLINVTALDPYYKGLETSNEIVTWIGGMTFPLRLPTSFSVAGAKVANIINSGDVETPIRIEISGGATNPKVLNKTTGEFIKINRTLLGDDVLIITTNFGNKRVELNGVNVFNYIDLASTFFSLEVGDNVIELLTDDVNDNVNIKISYSNRYLGV